MGSGPEFPEQNLPDLSPVFNLIISVDYTSVPNL